MHLNGLMRALFTLTFFFALLPGDIVGEEIATNVPLKQNEMIQQYASSLRVDEMKKKLDTAEKALKEAQAAPTPSPETIAQLEVDRDHAREKYDQAVAELQSNINQANQNNLRNQKLTANEQNSNSHQSKTGGSSKGGGSGSKGGMPPMPPPPSPPKKDSNEDSPAQESPKQQATQTPTTPPKDLTPAVDPKEEALSAELQKQLADLTAVNPNGTPKAENEAPETSTTLVAQKLATDTVKQSEEIAAKILKPELDEAPQKTTGTPIDTNTKPSSRVSQNQPRPQGLAGAMAAQVSSAPNTAAANQTDSRIASIAPAQSPTAQRALRAASSETAQAPSEEETPSSAPAFDMASLLGSPAEAPQSQDFNQTALRSERLTRSVRHDPLVNPNAPILPSALRAVMEGNKLVSGTPANR